MLEIVCKESFFHNQVAFYTGDSQLEWREVETGKLPSPRYGLRAVLVDNTIFVTSGFENNDGLHHNLVLGSFH